MQKDCGDLFHSNESLWVEDPKTNDTRGPPTNFMETLCPGLCSGRGNCVNARCICHENYTSIDCSIDKRKGPTLSWIRYGNVCDLSTRSDCNVIRIVGNDFMVTSNSSCRTAYLEVRLCSDIILASPSWRISVEQ